MTTQRYSRIFTADSGLPFDPGALEELSRAMACDEAPPAAWDDSRIPAAYTYFGQLLAHEISFDRSEGLPSGTVDALELENGRTAQITLDSVYGSGPEGPDAILFEEDGVRLRLGPVRTLRGPQPCDLLRRPDGSAVIADERNDENLVLAQMLVCLIKFHNRVANRLDRAAGGKASFEEVRACVVQHFQAAVLYDFTWRLIPDEVYHDILRNGRRIFLAETSSVTGSIALPVEFSHAAFRFGHSMAKSTYRWNGSIAFAALDNLLQNTGRNGRPNFQGLHPDWVIDWLNFLDFSGVAGVERRKNINFSRRIDTLISSPLGRLPAGECRNGEPSNLAQRDLTRGCALRLPSGQDAAQECADRFDTYVGRLDTHDFERIREPRIRTAFKRLGFDKRTPLWVYILAEAEIEQSGHRLGRLGGRIVGEVLHALVDLSPHSILREKGWCSTLASPPPDGFSLPELAAFAGVITRERGTA